MWTTISYPLLSTYVCLTPSLVLSNWGRALGTSSITERCLNPCRHSLSLSRAEHLELTFTEFIFCSHETPNNKSVPSSKGKVKISYIDSPFNSVSAMTVTIPDRRSVRLYSSSSFHFTTSDIFLPSSKAALPPFLRSCQKNPCPNRREIVEPFNHW